MSIDPRLVLLSLVCLTANACSDENISTLCSRGTTIILDRTDNLFAIDYVEEREKIAGKIEYCDNVSKYCIQEPTVIIFPDYFSGKKEITVGKIRSFLSTEFRKNYIVKSYNDSIGDFHTVGIFDVKGNILEYHEISDGIVDKFHRC
jgi:hypothetical protein